MPGLVPDDVFFDHLANRRFPAGNFIRTPEQLDAIIDALDALLSEDDAEADEVEG